MKKLRIGLSACFFYGDPKRPIFKGKTLLYLEQSLAHFVIAQGALAYLIPSAPAEGSLRLKDWADDLDGLVLQGGSDVSPRSYGEKALRPEWEGDYARDQYELELFGEFQSARKPILGICRGAQLVNIACGGTLYQDITTQVPGARVHRDWEIYDRNFHPIAVEPDSLMSKLYPGMKTANVNTVHHQGLKDLGKNLAVEARSEGDRIIEAVRGTGDSFLFAAQWHPEFQDPSDRSLLDFKPILNRFLEEAKRGQTDAENHQPRD